MVETVEKHDVIIQQDSARHYTARVTLHFIANYTYFMFRLAFFTDEFWGMQCLWEEKKNMFKTPIKTSTGFAIYYS